MIPRVFFRFSALALAVVAFLPAASAKDAVYDSVQQLLRDARNGDDPSGKLVLREVLVTSGIEELDSYEEVGFTIQDFERVNGQVRAVGESLRVRVGAYHSGQNPFDFEDDNHWDGEIEIGVKKGQVISLIAELGMDYDTDEWELVRSLDDQGLWDEDYYEVYVEGKADRDDYEYALNTLYQNEGIDETSDFGEEPTDLAEFNAFLQETFALEPITEVDQISERLESVQDLDRGLRAVFTIHEEGVEPVSLTPAIAFVRPYTRLRQDVVATIKVVNAGAKPTVKLGDTTLDVVHRLPGLLMVKIPEGARMGERRLTLVGDDGKTSEPFRVWVKRKTSAENPAPVLESATIVGGPQAAVMILEGAHFTQQGGVRLYLGSHRVTGIKLISRQHDTVHLELPVTELLAKASAGELSFKTAHVRIGRGRSNSTPAKGSEFLTKDSTKQPTAKPSVGGINQALGH